mmetsp:Transcript_16177/g.30029  ORF Transcript_16177/g.30029 Transcript_16177/m.30029 type:complete len:111 (-) Transcript_16177:852-1184(-)
MCMHIEWRTIRCHTHYSMISCFLLFYFGFFLWFLHSAYDPNNANYRKLSSWFWEQYTTYSGLWRDQPLWAYTLHHFNCTPAIMTSTGTITKGGDLFETGGRMGWDNHVYV